MVSPQSAKINIAAILRVVRVARPSVVSLLLVTTLYVLSSIIGTYIPYATGLILNDITKIYEYVSRVGSGSWPVRDLLVYAVTTIVAAIASSASTYASTMLVQNFVRDIRVSLVGYVHRATMAALSERTFGEISGRMTNDAPGIATQLEYVLFPQVSSVLMLVTTLGAVVVIDYRFAIIMLVPLVVSALPSLVVLPRFAVIARLIGSAQDRIQTLVQDSCTLAAALLIRNASSQRREMGRMRHAVEEARMLTMRQTALASVSSVIAIATRTLGPLAIMTAAIVFIQRGTGSHLSAGVVMALVMYQMRLYAPFNSLSGLQSQLATMSVSAERLCQLVDLTPEVGGTQPPVAGTLSFDGVGYSLADRRLFNDLSLSIKAGEHVAVVGPSGVGKSTLALMLLRLIEPQDGAIRLGATELLDFDLDLLRKHIVVVSQDSLLFDSSIRENLTFFDEHASDRSIARAVEMCRVREIIDRLPEGLDASVGQRGARLSGGERQRICLARALLAEPQVLVLDEALTGVDVTMEAAILGDIREAFAKRTILMITHRPGTADGFDRIITFESTAPQSVEVVTPV